MIDQKTCTQDASDRFDFLIGAITVSFALFVLADSSRCGNDHVSQPAFSWFFS